jgi:hypothetical protein
MNTICDKCNNYEVSPGKCTTKCWENLFNSVYLTKDYFHQRESGEKKSCKTLKPLPEIKGKGDKLCL